MGLLRTKRARWIAGTFALLVLVVGTLIGTPTGGRIHHIPLNMPSVTSTKDFSVITPPGVVPKNVLDALLVPANSQRTGLRNYDQGNGSYDRQVTISVPASPTSTKRFFSAAITDNAWKTISSKSTSTGFQILALHAGSDGHFWEIGVTVKYAPADIPALGLAAPAPGSVRTSVALRLMQYVSA